MFDTSSLPDLDALAGVDDAELMTAMAGWARVSAAADARRLATIAELARRRGCDAADDERQYWPVDPTDAAAAEVSAALNVGHRRALKQLGMAVTLHLRLPKINALFAEGVVSGEVAAQIVWRTMFVGDDTVAQVEASIAAKVRSWGPLSKEKLIKAIDQCVNMFDPAAVWQTRSAARNRNVTVGDPDDSDGTVPFWGRLLATDGELVDRRLTAMAKSVCKDDPRTLSQRRADAMGAWGAGAQHLACLCGSPECPAAADDGRASNVTLLIVADPSALRAERDPLIHGDGTPPDIPDPEPEREPEPETTAAETDSSPEEQVPSAAPTSFAAKSRPSSDVPDSPETFSERPAPQTESDPASAAPPAPRPSAGFIVGGGIVPPSLLAELVRTGAKVRFVGQPCAEGEPQYRPSTGLAECIRARDLTCRFPGCDRPADLADIDHTVPWPTGMTHPVNIKCYCRLHHLLKTMWAGAGWSDRQLPDGTVLITTPSGLTYTTTPAAALLFPSWNVVIPPPPQPPPPKGAKPRGNDWATFQRKRTRAQNREQRIKAEREHNTARIAARAAAAKAATPPVLNRDAARGTLVGTPEFDHWVQATRDYNAIQAENEEPPPF
jgi:hypothetical protein